jgi:phage terminase large subunit-like protein
VSLSPYIRKANDYRRGVLAGKIPACKWVRLACERQERELECWRRKEKSWPYEWRPQKAADFCEFVEGLPHVEGEWAKRNEKIRLEPWQCFIYTTVFGWYRKDGLRRFREVYLEIPRKNSKSTMTAGLGLFLLSADGEAGAQVYSAATTRDQAKIVWNIAKRMVRKDQLFANTLRIQALANSIFQEHTGSKFQPLSRDSKTLEGKGTSGGLIDELHAHKTREVYDVIETSVGARAQPLIWNITTAGSDISGICYEVRANLIKILEGVAQDAAMFGLIYTLDEGDDWTLEASWRKANPNYGVSVNPDDLARKAAKAMRTPSYVNTFLTKHLNIWVSSETAWMDMFAWGRCRDKTLEIEQFEGEPCWMGLDLASKIDIAALLYLFRREIDGASHFYPFLKSYLPEEAAEESKNSQYSGWAREGRLILTEGNITDIDRIEQDIREAASLYQIEAIGYDPFQATQIAGRLGNDGFPVVEVRPIVLNFSEAMKELEALVLSGRLHHDGDPVLTWMMSNVVAKLDNKDNIFPRKERPENKIDGMVALIMALDRAMKSVQKSSAYENERLFAV